MAHEFNMGLNSQEEWAWLVAIDFFLWHWSCLVR